MNVVVKIMVKYHIYIWASGTLFLTHSVKNSVGDVADRFSEMLWYHYTRVGPFMPKHGSRTINTTMTSFTTTT